VHATHHHTGLPPDTCAELGAATPPQLCCMCTHVQSQPCLACDMAGPWHHCLQPPLCPATNRPGSRYTSAGEVSSAQAAGSVWRPLPTPPSTGLHNSRCGSRPHQHHRRSKSKAVAALNAMDQHMTDAGSYGNTSCSHKLLTQSPLTHGNMEDTCHPPSTTCTGSATEGTGRQLL
jgi:hypothetical protein